MVVAVPSTLPEELTTVPLRWLLEQESLGLRLVEPAEVPEVALSWAHAIELIDPTPFLRGGELVLTTGLRLPRSRAEQVAYVRRLADAGVSGVAFGVAVQFMHIPPGLRAGCAEVGLPLLEVPLPTPFVAVSQAVAARLAEKQLAVMRRAVSFQQQMTRAALAEGTYGLVATLGRELQAAVVVLDDLQHVVASSGAASSGVASYGVASYGVGASDLRERVAAEITTLADYPGRASASVVSDHGLLSVQRLGGHERPGGWLAVELPHAVGVSERLLLNQAASLITLQQSRPVELDEARHRLGATVLDLLLDTEVVAPALVRHLAHFGFDPDDRVRMMAAVPGKGRTAPVEVVARALDVAAVPHVESADDDLALVLVRDADASQAADAVGEALVRAVRHDVVIGVSGPLRVERAAAGRAASRQAATSARASHQQVGWFGTLTLEAILADDVVRERVATLAASPLAPLLDSEAERDRVLVESLEVFLRHHGTWETASRALGVHRHTLRNRMSRVEELTGARLDVAEDRVALLLGLLARRRDA